MFKKITDEHAKELNALFYKGELTKLAFQVVLGLSLLAGGIVLLALRIPGWSIIFGLPMVVISSVFIIYTYDDVLNKDIIRKSETDSSNNDSKEDI